MSASRIVRVGLNCSIISLCAACIFYMYIYLMQPTHCFIKHDWRAHNSLKTKIHKTVHQLLQSPACSLSLMREESKKQAPYITFFTDRLRPVKKAVLGYTLPSAYALVEHKQKRYILTPEGFLDYNLYNTLYTKNLIVIESEQLQHKDMQQFLERAPDYVLEHYNIIWKNKTDILLKPKQMGLPLQVCADIDWNPERVYALKNFSTYLLSRPLKNKNLIIDLRLNNYIVLKTRSDA